MKFAIIGCGYLGTALAKKWKSMAIDLAVTTRKPERVSDLQEIASKVCLLEPGEKAKNLKKLLVGTSVLVLTLAPDKASEYESTYLATARSLEAALADNHSVTQIIYTSSTSVYGEHQGAWVDEKTPPSPLNPYAAILLETEQCLFKLTTPARKVCIFRLGEIYGPGREIHERLKRMSNRPFPGTGRNYTNLVHVNDAVDAIEFARISSLEGVYNLCNDLHIPRKEFYETICSRYGISNIIWDETLPSLHGGNKRVSSIKIEQAGFRKMLFSAFDGSASQFH